MKIALLGLSYTHPFSYSQILRDLGHEVAFVWDDQPARLASYVERFGARPVGSIGDVPLDAIDGVIATSPFPDRVDNACHFLRREKPVYMSKPMATTHAQLDQLADTVAKSSAPLLATSVLRFAPVIRTLRGLLRAGKVGRLDYVRAISSHFINHFVDLPAPDNWQDDPLAGGGTIVSMGIHAVEMLASLVGADFESVYCTSAKPIHNNSLSEDMAVIVIRWRNGLVGVADVACGVKTENFGVELYGDENILKCSLPKADVQTAQGAAVGDVDLWVELGYRETMAQFVRMIETGVSPIPFAESEKIARLLLDARESAAVGHPVVYGYTE